MDLVAIVLMAGQGTRMMSQIPKVLHPIMGRPMADYVLQALTGNKVQQIFGVVGFGAEEVQKRLKFEFVPVMQTEQKGTGHAVQQVLPHLKDFKGSALVLCGDAPLIEKEIIQELINFHQAETADLTILSGMVSPPHQYGRICKDPSGNILKIVEDRETTEEEKKINEVNSGVYLMNWPQIAPLVEKLPLHSEKNEYFLTDIVQLALQKKLRVKSLVCQDSNIVRGANNRRELSVLSKIKRERILNRLMDQGVTIIDPDNTYIDDPVSIGLDSIVYPYTVIEGEVSIGKSCQIGPFAHIRTGTILKDCSEIGNFVETKNLVMDSFSKAKHLTYLGDTQVGKKVNIGAGTITANYDGKNKYKTKIEDHCFIGSGSILIAPIEIKKNASTGAGAVVTKNHHVPEGSVVIGVPARIVK